MSLPYPQEVETKELRPGPKGPVNPLDLEKKISDLIMVDDRALVIAGCELRVPRHRNPHRLSARYRDAIRRRFLERRPNADDATWQTFVRKTQGLLSQRSKATRDVLPQILLLVDGL
jgi:hypothetical protein